MELLEVILILMNFLVLVWFIILPILIVDFFVFDSKFFKKFKRWANNKVSD